MTVTEQVSIEPALIKVAAALEATQRSDDSTLAGWTRSAAHLVRLQGQQGSLQVSNAALSTSAPDSMNAVSMLITDESGASAAPLHFVVAWQGLDVVNYTVNRAVVVLANGNGAMTGTFELSGAAGSARYIDLKADGTPYASTSGSITVSDSHFGGDCPDSTDASARNCTIGRESVAASFIAARADTSAPVAISWPASVLPAFRVVLGASAR
jgi:hypothetical protein